MNIPLQRDLRATVPDDLIELDQWVMWRYCADRRKVPFQVDGRPASSTDTCTWCSFEETHEALIAHPDYWAGTGFVFHPDDPYCGIDLDDCVEDDREIKPWAADILERFHDTYAEVSPSGTGIKIWCRAKIPRSATITLGDGHVEVYDRARYFTVTGAALFKETLGIEDHQSDVEGLIGLNAGKGAVPYRIAARIPYHQRHRHLVSIGGTLALRGLSASEIGVLFIELRKRFDGPPVADKNLTDLASDIVKRYAPNGQKTN